MTTEKLNFTENDIRPKDLLDGQKTAVMQDVGMLLSHADKFVSVNNLTPAYFAFAPLKKLYPIFKLAS